MKEIGHLNTIKKNKENCAQNGSNYILMKDIGYLKTIKNKRKLCTKWNLLQNKQNGRYHFVAFT